MPPGNAGLRANRNKQSLILSYPAIRVRLARSSAEQMIYKVDPEK